MLTVEFYEAGLPFPSHGVAKFADSKKETAKQLVHHTLIPAACRCIKIDVADKLDSASWKLKLKTSKRNLSNHSS